MELGLILMSVLWCVLMPVYMLLVLLTDDEVLSFIILAGSLCVGGQLL